MRRPPGPRMPNCVVSDAHLLVAMYVLLGRQVGYRPSVEQLHAVDIELHRHWLSKRSTASDDWEPNEFMKKRDFQELNPPRNMDEYYRSYDPWVGWGTALMLGSFMVLMVGNIAVKWIARRCRRLRQRFSRAKRPGLLQAMNSLHQGLAEDMVESVNSTPKQQQYIQLVAQSQSDSTCLTSLATNTKRSQMDDESKSDPLSPLAIHCDTDLHLTDPDHVSVLPIVHTALVSRNDDTTREGETGEPMTTTATIEYRPRDDEGGAGSGGGRQVVLKTLDHRFSESTL